MIRYFSSDKINSIRERLRKIYSGHSDQHLIERMDMLVGRYGVGIDPQPVEEYWSEKDNVLITYGDILTKDGEAPLVTLRHFLEHHFDGIIDTVHILPFFTYSSDDGFSVIDYREVRDSLGSWYNIEAFTSHFRLMFDLILNHVSRESEWFKNFVEGIAPNRDYFITIDPDTDLSDVVRPRSTPLLTKCYTRMGEKHVWATFSEDQIDLNFKSEDVLFEFLDILFYYIYHGVRIIRLDAIAYLWKEVGTSCIHLENTHEIVKLFRDILSTLAPHVLILTETNVPYEENLSYFGDGDEANIIYQFSLPPLLLHALQTGNSSYLTEFADDLPKPGEGMTYLNFTASHDGIGVRPLKGLIPQEEFDELIDKIKDRGGKISTKTDKDGTESPYELNITYLDALRVSEDDKEIIDRFMCSQAVAMALQGIPAVYFNNLVGSRNNVDGFEETGRARTLNRKKWDFDELTDNLNDSDSEQANIFNRYKDLLEIRSSQPAFHPDAKQDVLKVNEKLFVVRRTSLDGRQSIICIHNVSDEKVELKWNYVLPDNSDTTHWKDLVSGESFSTDDDINVGGYQVLWLTR